MPDKAPYDIKYAKLDWETLHFGSVDSGNSGIFSTNEEHQSSSS